MSRHYDFLPSSDALLPTFPPSSEVELLRLAPEELDLLLTIRIADQTDVAPIQLEHIGLGPVCRPTCIVGAGRAICRWRRVRVTDKVQPYLHVSPLAPMHIVSRVNTHQ